MSYINVFLYKTYKKGIISVFTLCYKTFMTLKYEACSRGVVVKASDVFPSRRFLRGFDPPPPRFFFGRN